MSAVGAILALLFGFFGWLTSFVGIFVLLLGFVSFFLLSIPPKITGHYKRLSNFYLWLLSGVLGRAAFVISAHNDLLLKRMSFDDRGVETMQFADTEKAFEDPDNARHYFYGIPFALADEVHGILFDPRHAAVGKQERTHERQDDMVVKATERERTSYDVKGWVRGVFSLPDGAHDILDLRNVRQIMTGDERAEDPKAVEKFVELSLEPYKSGTSSIRVAMIIGAMIVPFAVIWFMASQFGLSGATGPTDSISFGLLALLLSTAGLSDVDWKRAVAPLLALLTFLAVAVGLVFLAGVLKTIFVGLAFLLGVFLSLLFFRGLGGIIAPERTSRILLQLGLMGYDKPVFKWTPQKYVLREYEDLDTTDAEPHWYGIAGSLLGFTYEPSPESFQSAHVDTNELQNRAEVRTDGSGSTNIPAGYTRFPEQQRAVYAGFVPTKFDDDHYYIDTGIALNAFTYAAVGLKSHRFLTRAKKKFGGEGGISDKRFLYAVTGSGLMSFLSGLTVFVVLPLL